MPESRSPSDPRDEPAFLRRAFLAPASAYPFWHLAAPAHAVDPWWAWWAVAASFWLVGLSSLVSTWVERRLLGFFNACAALTTLQLYLLAFANDMAPFYTVGSALSVLATVLFIRSRQNLLAYGAFVGLLGMTLYVVEPEGRKLAYWGGVMTVVVAWYLRVTLQEASASAARRRQEELEGRVRERTAELADTNRLLRHEMEERERLEEQLRLAQTMEAVGRLAGGVAHEFNNRLTTMRLCGELLRDRLPPDSPLLADLEQIQKAGADAASLTQQLLDFSRGGERVPEVLDLKAVVQDVLGVLRSVAGEDVTLVCDLDEGPLPLWEDRAQVERVLVNLTLNARDAMPEGGRLVIETQAVCAAELRDRDLPSLDPAGDCVLLSVRDTGIGMDEETRARAFDPFFTRKPVGDGTGLGLSIVYGIVTQAGGAIRLDSEPGKGARFDLVWPRTTRAPAALEGSGLEPAPRGAEHILLVEDEGDLREALARLLRASGYRVVVAPDASAALEAAGKSTAPFDLVVTDVVMPGMNGLELVERLVAQERVSRAIFLSGHMNHPSLRGRDLPPGFPLVHKPFDVHHLTATIREVLDAEVPRARG
jgi:signal transduction histidine kinase/CheY-like chemotaxis protein